MVLSKFVDKIERIRTLMRIISLIALLVLLALPPERVHAQQAKLSGKLILPVLRNYLKTS